MRNSIGLSEVVERFKMVFVENFAFIDRERWNW